MEAFNGEDVDPLARTAFRIVFMDAKGEHLGDQAAHRPEEQRRIWVSQSLIWYGVFSKEMPRSERCCRMITFMAPVS